MDSRIVFGLTFLSSFSGNTGSTICSVLTCWFTRGPVPTPCQYPSYFQPMNQTTVPPKGDMSKASGAGQPALSVDTTGNGNKGPVRPAAYQNSTFNSNGSYNRGAQSTYQDAQYGFGGVHSPLPWVDSSVYSNGLSGNNTNTTPLSNANVFASKNHNFRTNSHLVVRFYCFMFLFII